MSLRALKNAQTVDKTSEESWFEASVEGDSNKVEEEVSVK
jgi:hypothetical protein